jgi:hypothetical protein
MDIGLYHIGKGFGWGGWQALRWAILGVAFEVFVLCISLAIFNATVLEIFFWRVQRV